MMHHKNMSRHAIHKFTIVLFAVISAFVSVPAARAQIGLDFLNLSPGAEIGEVLARLYVFGVGFVALTALVMMVIGGVQYMVTAGDRDPGPAKERIKNAIWGLILALASWLILYTINPDLTKKVIPKPLEIKLVPATTPRPDALGAGAQEYRAINLNIQQRQTCFEVFGARWQNVDTDFCGDSSKNACCGYFPPQESSASSNPPPEQTAANCTAIRPTACRRYSNCQLDQTTNSCIPR